MDRPTAQSPSLPPPLGEPSGHANQHPQQCILHLDVLELILQEHRNDPFTLASSALASQSLLQIARKFLYRSVSLDYCENPYGHEQQRKLRLSLARNFHLCGYVRTLRLSLPAASSSSSSSANAGKGKGDGDDETSVLDAILRELVRLESLHLIGNGIASPNLRVPDGTALSVGRGAGGLAGALKKVFALPSLRKVTLENIYPLEEVYVSCFTELKHLELISVGVPVDPSNSPPSSASTSASESDSTTMVQAESSISSTTSSLASESPSSSSSPSLSSSSTPALTPSSATSPNSASSPSEPSSSSTSPNSASRYFDLSNRSDDVPPISTSTTSSTSPKPRNHHTGTQLSDLDSRLTLGQSTSTATGSSPGFFSSSEVLSLSTGGVLASSFPKNGKGTDSNPHTPLNSTRVSGISDSGSGEGSREWSEADTAGRRTRREGTRTRRSWTCQKRVHLEYLVLNLEHLSPLLDLISSRGQQEGISDRDSRREMVGQGITEDEDEGVDDQDSEDEEDENDDKHSEPPHTSSRLDFSKLKQIHVYVWNPNDADGIWTILHSARRSLERLTLRYFQYTEDHLPYHLGFDNLQSLVVGTDTISIKEDPFQSLIQFFSDPAKFPSLRRLKISFDLWGCESSGATWKEVGGYRGWRELDGVLAALDNHQPLSGRCFQNSREAAGGDEGRIAGDGLCSSSSQLSNIVFEIWCSSGYKGTTFNGKGLLALIRDELSYLGRNQTFMLV